MTTATAIPTKSSWYVSIAAVLLLFVIVGVYSSRMAHETTGYDQEQARLRYATLAKMRETDRKTLTTADWIDKDKGVVRIPIDEAVIEEVPLLAAKPVTMGTAIPGATTMNTVPAAPSPGAAPATNAPPFGSATASSASGTKPAAPASANPTTNAAPTGAAQPPK